MIMTTDPRIGPDWARFGEWVARKQDALGLSDRELARRTGLSATHIGKIRKGQTGTKDDAIDRIAIALHATPEEARKTLIRPVAELIPEEAEMLAILHNVPVPEWPRFLTVTKATGQAFTHPN